MQKYGRVTQKNQVIKIAVTWGHGVSEIAHSFMEVFMSNNIIARCMGISRSCFLNAPYKDQSDIEMYAVDGHEHKASGICHYCTVDTLKAIVSKGRLRFSDVRFLNDSTEFTEIISLVENVLSQEDYTLEFKKFINESSIMKELKEYRQSYVGFSRITHQYEQKMYRTYTCSFSTNNDSLSMWNYYASSGEGVSISFDFSWNMFEGSNESEVNTCEKLENDIIIYRGLILYKDFDKKKCIMELLNRLQEIYNKAESDIEKYQGYILYAFKEAINYMRCFFKNKLFECENEYRIVLKIPEELLLSDNNFLEKGQFKRGNVLIPFVDYEFKRESLKRITLNPYFKEEDSMFKLGIKELLWQNQMEDVCIVPSNIPIRQYC